MKYTILDPDGDCVTRGYHSLDAALRQAKYWLLRDLNTEADVYKFTIHEMFPDETAGERVATVTLELSWEVTRR